MSAAEGAPPPVRRARGLRARLAGLRSRLDLRDRVTLATAGVLAAGVAVLSAATLLLLFGQIEHGASSTLSERVDAQLAVVMQVAGRTTVAHGRAIEEESWVFDTDGRVVKRARATPAIEQVAHALADVPRPTERDVGDEVRLLAEPAYAHRGGERIGTVVVALSLEPYKRTERLAVLAIAFLDVCIVIFGALLARRAVGKALEPVADMTAHAAEWSEHDLDRRFARGPARDELTALSATLDSLLARIAASVRREQRFSAEMAHELRTPLAGIRGEAELALSTPGASTDVRAALEQVLHGAGRMQRVIDALLAAARGESGDGGISDAAAAAQEAVDAVAPLAERAGVRLVLLGTDATASNGSLRVGAEQQLVVQAIAPLLANAVRHARSGITLRLQRDGGDLLLHVEDDGDGFAASDAEAAFAPGVSSSGGAGLGLPLARRLARSVGGEVSTTASTGGGHVVLRLPAIG